MNDFVSQLIQNGSCRTISMEEASREFELVREDENGGIVNDVLRLLTRDNTEKPIASESTIPDQILHHFPHLSGITPMRDMEKEAIDHP